MKQCSKCYKTSPMDAIFCISCGERYTVSAMTDRTIKLDGPSVNASGAPANIPFIDYSNEPLYISRKDADHIFRATETYVFRNFENSIEGYDIFYYGRKVIFVDD